MTAFKRCFQCQLAPLHSGVPPLVGSAVGIPRLQYEEIKTGGESPQGGGGGGGGAGEDQGRSVQIDPRLDPGSPQVDPRLTPS